ncbi:MAG: SDR family NAD(P)-dependent oxidoreductase, partial [Planctomycetes bacterium]|nr:SDR family NAD(P)-dependent oxidoreductase [Planctomycetota bacterium]
YMCFSKTPALSPTGDARPFAADGDGTILGEGLGVCVMKRLADAERDGDRIYAVISGLGAASDGKGAAIYAPTAEGQARCLRDAYRQAGVDPRTVELLEAHGTGTKVGDATEIRGLDAVFGAARREGEPPWCALGSVKSMIGHTKAAAGAAGLIKAALALHHQVLPPTLKVTRPNPALDEATPFYVNTEKRPWLPHGDHPRRAAVSAFGFGGSNFHCVLEEYAGAEPGIDWDGEVQVWPLAARDRAALGRRVGELAAAEWRDWDAVRAAAGAARRDFDATAPVRLVAVIECDRVAPAELFHAALGLLEKNAQAAQWSSPLGLWFGGGQAPGALGMVFPGQGSQYPGMLRDLACAFPTVRGAFAESGDRALLDAVYPQPAFDEAAQQRQRDQLRRTDVAQPAIGAVSLGALDVLAHFGVRPAAATGHSFGELTALCAAGRLTRRALHRLARTRGALMAEGDGDRGGMLAVFAAREAVEALLAEHELPLLVANRNAPRQVVVSGPSEAIAEARRLCEERRLRCRVLEVAAAFHSPSVAAATEPFGEALREVAIAAGTMPVFANTTGAEYPADAGAARALLAGQLAAPVEFQRCIEAMLAAGVATFVEVGPGAVLTGLVDEIRDGRPDVVAVALDASRGRGRSDLARLLACLAARGHAVELARWDPEFAAQHSARTAARRPAFSVPLNGANYRSPRPPRPPVPRRPEPVHDPLPTTAPPSVPEPQQTPTHDPTVLGEVLRAHQQSLLALVQLQQQTAQLHQRFLDGQAQATRALEQLVAAQPLAFGMPAAGSPLAGDWTAPQVVVPEPAPAPLPVHAVAVPTPAPAEAEPPVKLPSANVAPAPSSAVTEVLLAVVAEKTGYPAEMLELSMGLDADLGIDSIKRVEILAALQERLPDAPVVKPEHLGELHTLADIVAFLGAPRSAAAPAARTPEPSSPPPAAVMRYVVVPRPVPSPQDAANPFPPDALLWVTRTADPLSASLVERLRELGIKASEVERTTTATPPADLAGLVVVAPLEDQPQLLHEAFALVRHVGPRLRERAEHQPALLATIARLDGSFGFGELAVDAVGSGGLAGLTKTVAHEWPQVRAVALDLDASETDANWAAARLVPRLLGDTVGEVGIRRAGSCALELVAEASPEPGEPVFRDPDLLLVTGGARGVTAEVAIALATAGAPRLLLLGRAALPDPEPEWLRGLTREADVRQALLAHAGRKLSPRELAEAFAGVCRDREMLRNIARMEAAGSRVVYRAVDVRDRAALRTCLTEVADKLGPITGVIHGAGVLADSYITDKTDAEFARVLATKVDGFRALLDLLADQPLRAVVAFSSSTARFGRTGQADYAVANEVLNKLCQRERVRRPDTRVLSVNWGPWDGGMVTPALREVFAGEGVSVIDLDAGARYLLGELGDRGGPVEVVVLGAGSALPDAGVDREPTVLVPNAPVLAALPELPVVVSRPLTLAGHDYLAAHVIDGRAVLPVAMMVELLGHAALHGNPGLRFRGIDGLQVFRGLRLGAGERVELRVGAGRAVRERDTFVVETELGSVDGAGTRALHARARVVLAATLTAAPAAAPAPELPPYPLAIERLYREQLFHGPLLHCIQSIDGCDDSGIVGAVRPATDPGEWLEQPLRRRWIAEPGLLDGAFQLMIAWSFQRTGQGSLPTAMGSYRQFVERFPSAPVRVEARVSVCDTNRAVADLDWLGAGGEVLARLSGYECVVDGSLAAAFRRNELDTRTAARR